MHRDEDLTFVEFALKAARLGCRETHVDETSGNPVRASVAEGGEDGPGGDETTLAGDC